MSGERDEKLIAIFARPLRLPSFLPRSLTSFVAGIVSAERLLLSMTLLVYQGSHDRMYCCKIEKATTMIVWEGGREGKGE